MKSLDGVNKKNDVNNTASEAPEKNVKTESEKIEKNPEFSNKLGVKNTSDFISDKQQKMNHSQLDEC